ncbi:DUF3106 domain-containing protein [Arenimonas composti]|uniref:DUF3106 domain-containing protein n=1 Tax=Arenimonas composti TR7-09 = DSM 18010 TaxID=1121013 RepID=A0A091BEH2_9GAMM|nr:DUF3106 domain-containing protein [Arenimonas composti]KFN51073.1 hypothetical protein P873_04015 [Arenimonas composti TR7-09 = DSM 18010]
MRAGGLVALAATLFLAGLAGAAAAVASPPRPAVEAAAPARTQGVRHDDDPRQEEPAPGHRRRHRMAHGLDFPTPVPAGVVVPRWDELDAERQRQLEHLRETWDQLPASRRALALERIERHARWRALSPEERERLREGARNFHDLSPELREKMRTSFHVVNALPAPEREHLLARWRAMDPQQRRAWLEAGGPGIAPEPGGD